VQSRQETELNRADRLQPRSFRSVLVIDGQSGTEDVVTAILNSAFPGLEIRFAADWEAALQLPQALSAQDLVLLEPGQRGRFCMEILTQLRARFPAVPVVIRSSIASRAAIRAAFNAGVLGYFPKTMAPSLATAGLQFVAVGGIFVPPEVLGNGMDEHPSHPADPALTASQTKVLRLLLTGRRNREIASALNITEGTVKQHVHALYRALGVTSRAAVIARVAWGALDQDQIKQEPQAESRTPADPSDR
jgi:DNA-binding NarL/FixJ family response regulator